ncbi:50S ribosomal protein L25 [Acetomicrobium hydrogeniformans]|jgi:large subunit ribosomal protein L25|uniref:Large ribosomal subunit protein bL25 n=1 Tax=Acetomicrobium hydrogeniformans ATCC BAA-1850 TaxID=592015 RepID=A0A0T5XCB8_9BACT|nr:50S ribosomal protein L25 [Acetomicrobium hydrogeniformans]KRT36006.1 ribosomal protein L25, Ctc-form [Acetomicrobium hydrogeniformans ATCC BAA-1850]
MTVGNIDIRLEYRENLGKNRSKRLRKEGYLPAVFYGPDYKEAVPVKVSVDEILPHIHSSHWKTLMFNVIFPDGKKEMAMIRDYQRDPISRQVLHIDFYQLVKGHRVLVAVPIVLINRESCLGVKKGGVLIQSLHELEMEVLPTEMPDEIHVDIAGLDVGDSLRISDINLPESALVSVDLEDTVVQIVEAVEEVEEEAAEEVEREVEVIGKKPTAEEEEE